MAGIEGNNAVTLFLRYGHVISFFMVMLQPYTLCSTITRCLSKVVTALYLSCFPVHRIFRLYSCILFSMCLQASLWHILWNLLLLEFVNLKNLKKHFPRLNFESLRGNFVYNLTSNPNFAESIDEDCVWKKNLRIHTRIEKSKCSHFVGVLHLVGSQKVVLLLSYHCIHKKTLTAKWLYMSSYFEGLLKNRSKKKSKSSHKWVNHNFHFDFFLTTNAVKKFQSNTTTK